MDPSVAFPTLDPSLTPAGCADAVVDLGRRRKKQGTLESAPDYFAGASAVLQYLFPAEDGRLSRAIPPAWMIMLMCGRGDELLKEVKANATA